MRKWTFYYKIEGSIDINAETAEEAREEFYSKSGIDIIENCFCGAEITDIISEEIK